MNKFLGTEAEFNTLFGIPTPTPKPPAPSPVPAGPKEAQVNMPIYRPGESGPGIRALQEALLGLGWGTRLGLEPTGHYDAKTTQAVRNFQAAHHIGPADHWGPECWTALFPTP